jgi:hypothetical protein
MKNLMIVIVIQYLLTNSIYSQSIINLPDTLTKKFDLKEIIKKYNFKLNGKVLYVVRQSNSIQKYVNYTLFYQNKLIDSLSKFQDKMDDYLIEKIDSFIFKNKADTNIFIINEFENRNYPLKEEVCILLFENDTKYYFFYWFGNTFSPFVGNERNKYIKYKFIDLL